MKAKIKNITIAFCAVCLLLICVSFWCFSGLKTKVFADGESHTISFNANGGSGEMTSVVQNDGDEFVLPACEFASPNGKQFYCWAIDSIYGVQMFANDSITITKNIILYAIWNGPTEFSIDFLPNGGSGEMQSLTNVNSLFVLPDCTFTAPAGKMFLGYKISGDEQNDVWQVGTVVQITRNITFVALWKNDCIETSFSADDINKQIAGSIQEAQSLNKELWITIGENTIKFDVYAVQSFENPENVALLFDVQEENINAVVKGAKKVLNIALDGSSFSDGEVTITMPLNVELTKKQTVKVFYVDGNNVTPLETTWQDGQVSFVTTHFSQFVVAVQQKEAQLLPTWAIVCLIIGALIVVLISGFAIYWFGIQKNTFRDLKYIFKK